MYVLDSMAPLGELGCTVPNVDIAHYRNVADLGGGGPRDPDDDVRVLLG
jgi:hypothetical protein